METPTKDTFDTFDRQIADLDNQIRHLKREKDQLEDRRWELAKSCAHFQTHVKLGMTWCDICGANISIMRK